MCMAIICHSAPLGNLQSVLRCTYMAFMFCLMLKKKRAEAVQQGREDEASVIWPKPKKLEAPVAAWESGKGAVRRRVEECVGTFLGSSAVRQHWAMVCLLVVLVVIVPYMAWTFYNGNSLHARLLEYEEQSSLIRAQIVRLQLLLSISAAKNLDNLLSDSSSRALLSRARGEEGGVEDNLLDEDLAKELLGVVKAMLWTEEKAMPQAEAQGGTGEVRQEL